MNIDDIEGQLELFPDSSVKVISKENKLEAWQSEWVGMPEFVQEKQTPYAQIIFRFRNEDDLQEFAKLIGQKLTPKTKSAWFPKIVRGLNSKKRYTHES